MATLPRPSPVCRWYIPPDRGCGQDKAITTYLAGLEAIRRRAPAADPLEPSWGEPELLMNLAWSSLNGDRRGNHQQRQYNGSHRNSSQLGTI